MHKGIVPLCWAIGHIAQPWLGICCPIETEFYYLQSRYYDSEMGRFLNADALMSTGQGILGNNMFAYCGNNPENTSDFTGDIPKELDYRASSMYGGGTSGPIIPIRVPYDEIPYDEKQWKSGLQNMAMKTKHMYFGRLRM